MAEQEFYKKLLLDVLAMKGRGIENLHNRVKKLILVFEDHEFRADIGGDDFDLAVILDQYLDDCAIGFLELRAVMKEFPHVEQWKKDSLKSLYRKAIEKSAETVAPQNISVIEPKERPTRKQYEAIERQAKESQALVLQTKSELEELREENAELRIENERLKVRVADLEERVSQWSGMSELSMVE